MINVRWGLRLWFSLLIIVMCTCMVLVGTQTLLLTDIQCDEYF